MVKAALTPACLRTTKTKAPADAWVPQTREEVAEAIAAIGRAQRARLLIAAALNETVAAAKAKAEAEAQSHSAEILRLRAGVQTWCAAHRAELTQGGRIKTALFATGEVRWRATPPRVVLRGVDEVLKRLQALGLERFVRTKHEVNKEAILADPDAVRGIEGVSLESREEFVIVPVETALEEIAS
jgi:phage host-nuclease inhibitor protein Gam